MFKRIVMLLVILLASGSMIVYAQTDQLPPMAAVTDRQLTLYNVSGGVRQVMRAEGRLFDNLVWSPDGQHLVFTASSRLMLTDRGGAAPSSLAEDVYTLPATFASDSSRVIYAGSPGAQVESNTGLPTYALDVYSQPVSPGAAREVIGQIHFGTGCGGGSPFPMDTVYNIEAGFGGSDMTFVNTDSGLLHSHNCAGRGLSLLNLDTGESTDLGGGLQGASVSPDRTQVAALEGGTIVAIDLASRARRTHSAQSTPDQIGWGADNNTLYYSVRALLGQSLPISEQEAQAVASFTGRADPIPQYTVSIRRVDLNSGQETEIYSGPGWAVGQMFASNGSLYFSLVPNGEVWVETVASGTLDLSTPDGAIKELATVAVTMLRVPVNGGAALEIAQDIGQAALLP